MWWWHLLLIVALFNPGPVFGEYYNGNEIYSWLLLDSERRHRKLNDDEWYNLALASGYLAGVTDSASSGSLICLPAKLQFGQAIDVTINYLQSRPEIRHRIASDLLVEALQRSFPCRK
jgi:hypothetical protein